MQYIFLTTKGESLRSEVIAWSHEDINLYKPGTHIGMIPGPDKTYQPNTVFQALHDGYKPVGMPRPVEETWYDIANKPYQVTLWCWHLYKEE